MATYQELANQYFGEYQVKNTDELAVDLQRWESAATTIRSMPLAERATYADYVTKNICEKHPEIAVQYTRDEIIPMLTTVDYATANTCAIANVAAHLMLLPENERAPYDKPIPEAPACIIC